MRILYIPKPKQSSTSINYGYLYNWWAATDSKNIAASGWHLPTLNDWHILLLYVDSSSTQTYCPTGGKLKENDFEHWSSPNSGATNEFHFNALGTGYRTNSGGFANLTQGTTYVVIDDGPFSDYSMCGVQLTYTLSQANSSQITPSISGVTSHHREGNPIRLIS